MGFGQVYLYIVIYDISRYTQDSILTSTLDADLISSDYHDFQGFFSDSLSGLSSAEVLL